MGKNMKMNLKHTFTRHGLARAVFLDLIALIMIFPGSPSFLRAETLEHRYSFVSDASDSVGGTNWNGTIVAPNGGGAATIGGGLNLPGNAGGGNGISGYVALPGGILLGDDSVTVECWVTQLSPNGWATVWDFANSGTENFEMCPFPDNNDNNLMSAFTPHDRGRAIRLRDLQQFHPGRKSLFEWSPGWHEGFPRYHLCPSRHWRRARHGPRLVGKRYLW
jgi:hypothetical protein